MILFVNFDGTSRLPGARFGGKAFKDLLNISCEHKVIDGYLKTNDEVFKKIQETTHNEDIRLAFGGEHSISYPLIVKQIEQGCRKIVIFDAHHDSYNYEQITHFSFVSHLLNKYKVEIMVVGARYELDKSHPHLKHLSITDKSSSRIATEIKEFVQDKDFYLSIDLDLIDPSEWEQVSSPVASGIAIKTLSQVIKKITALKNLKAVDMVEWNPMNGVNQMSTLAPLTDLLTTWLESQKTFLPKDLYAIRRSFL